MGRLIKAEFLKLSKSLGYKILLISGAAFGVLFAIMFTSVDVGMEVNGQIMYLQVITDISLQAVFACILAATFICNEFSNRTFGVSIMSGCSRFGLLFAKTVAYIAGLLTIIFVYPVVVTAVTTVIKGFGDTNAEIWRHLLITTLLFAVGIIAMGCCCIMLAVLIKKIGGTIGAGLGLLLPLIIVGQFADNLPTIASVLKFNFAHQLTQAAQPESVPFYLAVMFVTIAVTLTVSKICFDKSELK